MPTVQRLSDALANQIAAGEVVERPASAVKELVENAVDAGARRVEVALEDGGRRRLSVVDDGSGMSREDALLALERHTTSKLRSADDLFDIRSFGFRGEALPSIASVSRLTLTTRRSEDLAATRIVVEGGRVTEVADAGAPPGTRLEVEDLFFNVPARLKFLKSRATELGHVSDWLTRLALARPDVALQLTEGGRTHLRADATAELKERIAAVLGREAHAAMYPVEGELGEVRVRGFTGGPGRANSTAREIFTFVNRRYVRDRGLLHAIARAYEGVLPIGRSPACVLFVELPPERVDVNVHPQKLEVRFAEPRSVYDALARTLSSTLAASPWLGAAARPTRSYVLRSEPAPTSTPAAQSEAAPPPPATREPWRPRPETRALFASDSEVVELPAAAIAGAARAPAPSISPPPATTASPSPAPAVTPAGAPAGEDAAGGERLLFSRLRYLGQIHRTYLVCESPEGLVLLDQHAAHERVIYERLRARRAGGSAAAQPLLFPLTLHLSSAESALVEASREELSAVGFELEPFGGNSWSLTAAPPGIEGVDPGALVRDLAEEARAFGRASQTDALEKALLARLACHTAVRAGDPLAPEEATELLRSLDGTPFGSQCPHGRPVATRFGEDALREMFGRTYEGTPRAAARERYSR